MLLVVVVLLAGAALGLLWWLLAPTARAQVSDGQVFLAGHQELQAGQDGWFTVVTGLAGVLVATVVATRHGRRPAVDAVVAAVCTGLAGVVAWRTGVLLGPDALTDQVRDGANRPLTPLVLSTPSALLVGPLLFCLTRFLAALFSGDQERTTRGR